MRDRDNQLAMKLTTAKGHLAVANKTALYHYFTRRKATNFQDAKRFWESASTGYSRMTLRMSHRRTSFMLHLHRLTP